MARRLRDVPDEPDQPAATGREIVVCGLDHLGLRTVAELLLGDEPVVAVGSGEAIAAAAGRLDGIRVVEGDHRREAVLRQAGVATAAAIVLTAEDDLGNVQTALTAQELNPAIRIVLRLFDAELGAHIQALFPNAVALSSSAVASPGFVAAALDGDGGASFELAGHLVRSRLLRTAADEEDRLTTIPVARIATDRTAEILPAPGAAVDGDTVVIDIARAYVRPAEASRSVLDQARATTGTVVAEVGSAIGGVGGEVRAIRSRLRGAAPRVRPRRFRPERRLVRFATILILLAIVSALYFEWVAGLSPLDAFSYAVTLLTGAALPTSLDPAEVGAALKVYAIGLSIVGAAIVAVVYALITDAIIRSRLLQTLGRRSVPSSISDHVIVVGLGSIGYRVALGIAGRGVPVVVADIAEDGRFASAARAAGIPVVAGDARHAEVLGDLGIERARAMIAATSDDLVNLAAALNARAIRPDLRVVVRLFDPEFAVRVQRGFGIRFTRSVSHLAAPAFAAAAIGSEVVATVPIGDRRVVLFARVPVLEGSPLAGAPISTIDEPGARRVLAIDGPAEDDAAWSPRPDDAPKVGDELIVATTRSGLATLMDRARAAS